MNTGKAVIAGLVVTIGLLAATFGFEAIAQVAGPEEIEEKETDELHEEDGDETAPTEDLDLEDGDQAPGDVDTEDEDHEG